MIILSRLASSLIMLVVFSANKLLKLLKTWYILYECVILLLTSRILFLVNINIFLLMIRNWFTITGINLWKPLSVIHIFIMKITCCWWIFSHINRTAASFRWCLEDMLPIYWNFNRLINLLPSVVQKPTIYYCIKISLLANDDYTSIFTSLISTDSYVQLSVALLGRIYI